MFVRATCKAREVFSKHHSPSLPVLRGSGASKTSEEGGAEWEGKKLPDNTSTGAKSQWVSDQQWEGGGRRMRGQLRVMFDG